MGDVPVGSFERRETGDAPVGYVGLRNFDQGVVEALGAQEINGNYYIVNLFGGNYPLIRPEGPLQPPPAQPGVPVTFAFPDELSEHWRFPCVVVRRDDIAPAMNRWHPGALQYRAPAAVADRIVSRVAGKTLVAYSHYEANAQAIPFDLTYTVSIMAKYRGQGVKAPLGQSVDGNASPKTQANKLLDHVLRCFPPYGWIRVKDSLDDVRQYAIFMEAMSHLDQVAETTDRTIGFALTVRVEAEFDLRDPVVQRAVGEPLIINESIKSE